MAGTGPHGPMVGGAAEPREEPQGGHRFSAAAIAELDEIISHYPEKRAAMLPALWIAQREYGGFLTPEAMKEVADRLERPVVEVEADASYYTMYNFRKRGRHHLEVCTCLTCSVVGAYDVVHKLEKLTGCPLGQTSADGVWSVAEVECLDWRGAGTVIQVGDRYYGNVTADNVEQMVQDLKATDAHTPVALADSITKVMLPGKG